MKLRVPSATIALVALTAAVTTGTTLGSAQTASAGQCPATRTGLSNAQKSRIAQARAKKQPVVLIKACVFGHPDRSVHAGAKVLVVNEDNVAHTWESTVKAFDSGIIKPGASTSVSIPRTAKAKYTLKCDIHSFMHGALSVVIS